MGDLKMYYIAKRRSIEIFSIDIFYGHTGLLEVPLYYFTAIVWVSLRDS